MEHLSLPELIRLTKPYLNKGDEDEAFRYWSTQSAEAKLNAGAYLTRQFYSWRGIDVDRSTARTTTRLSTFAEENLESEATDVLYQRFRESVR